MLIVEQRRVVAEALARAFDRAGLTVAGTALTDRKSTRLNSSHRHISYSAFFF